MTVARILSIIGFLTIFVTFSLLSASIAQVEFHGLGDARSGEEIYVKACVACHGRDGRGTAPGIPDFSTAESVLVRDEGLLTRSDTVLLTHILNGFSQDDQGPGGSVEKDSSSLTIQNLRDVLAYVHDHFHYQTHAHAGEGIYFETCIACHGENGKGTIPGAPDLTSERGVMYQSDTVLLDHILNGFQSPGSSMGMPAKGANEDLTIADLKNVLDYLHQNFHYQTYRAQ